MFNQMQLNGKGKSGCTGAERDYLHCPPLTDLVNNDKAFGDYHLILEKVKNLLHIKACYKFT